MRFKWKKHWWRLVWEAKPVGNDNEAVEGYVDWQYRRIRIEEDMRDRGREELELYLHELLHLGCPYLSEEEVTIVSKLQTKILYRLGYRKNGQKE